MSNVSPWPISLTPPAVESQHPPAAATISNRSAAAVTRDVATRVAATDAVFGKLPVDNPFDNPFDKPNDQTLDDFDFWLLLAKR